MFPGFLEACHWEILNGYILKIINGLSHAGV